MADTNIQYYRDTRTVFTTSNGNGKTAIGSADATIQGLEIEYNLLTTPEAFKISPLGVNYTSGVINDTTLLPRIAQVESLLQSVEVPPDSTTLQVDKKILLTDGVSSGSIDFVGLNTQIDVSNNLILNPTGSINTNGKVLDMTNGEIHNCPLIQSLFNNDITIEGRGTGDVVLKTNGINRLSISETGSMTFQGGMTYDNATNNLTATTFTGSATQIEIANQNASSNFYPVFVSGTGATTPFIDINTSPLLRYNPFSGVLTVGAPPVCDVSANAVNQLVNFNNFSANSYSPSLYITTAPTETPTYSVRSGSYIKLNNICFVQINIEITDFGTFPASGNLAVTLPVNNIGSVTASFSVGSVEGLATSGAAEITASSGQGGNGIALGIRKLITTTSANNLTLNDITTSFKIKIGGSYIVA